VRAVPVPPQDAAALTDVISYGGEEFKRRLPRPVNTAMTVFSDGQFLRTGLEAIAEQVSGIVGRVAGPTSFPVLDPILA
jgi:hypothetical protein